MECSGNGKLEWTGGEVKSKSGGVCLMPQAVDEKGKCTLSLLRWKREIDVRDWKV